MMLDSSFSSFEPPSDCALCPRLYTFRQENRLLYPQWHNAPVPIFFPSTPLEKTQLVIIGLAPGLKGANRTGRPFTGDFAGFLLYETLKKYGFAQGSFDPNGNDTLQLLDCMIVNAVRCVPPQNKPLTQEITQCRCFFSPLLKSLPSVKAILTLGGIAHNSTIRALGGRLAAHPFAHNKITCLQGIRIVSSYHCSRYNTNTGRLTEAMFHQVFDCLHKLLGKQELIP